MLWYRDDDPVESRASSLDADGLVIQYQAINHDADQQLILLLDQEVSSHCLLHDKHSPLID